MRSGSRSAICALVVAIASGVLGVGVASATSSVTPGCDTTYTNWGLWSDAANWDHGVPTASSNACVEAGAQVDVQGQGVALSLRELSPTASVAVGTDIGAVSDDVYGTLTIGKAGVATVSTADIQVAAGTLSLAGAVSWHPYLGTDIGGISTGRSGWLDLGTGGSSVAQSAFYGQATGTGTITATSSSGSSWVVLGPHVVLDWRASGTASEPDGQPYVLNVAAAPAGGGITELGPHFYEVSDSGVTLNTDPATTLRLDEAKFPAAANTLSVPTQLGGPIEANLTLTGPVSLRPGVQATVNAGTALSIAQALDTAGSTLEVDGTLAGTGSLHNGGALDGTGTISVPATNDNVLWGSLSFTKPFVQDASGTIEHDWDAPPFQFTSAVLNGTAIPGAADEDAVPADLTRAMATATGTLTDNLALRPFPTVYKTAFELGSSASAVTVTSRNAVVAVTATVDGQPTTSQAVVDVDLSAAEGVPTGRVWVLQYNPITRTVPYLPPLATALVSGGSVQLTVTNPPPAFVVEYSGDQLHEGSTSAPLTPVYVNPPPPVVTPSPTQPAPATTTPVVAGGGAKTSTTVALPALAASSTLGAVEKKLRALGFRIGDLRTPSGYPRAARGHHYVVAAYYIETTKRVRLHGKWVTEKSYKAVKAGSRIPKGSMIAIGLKLV